MLDKGTGNKTWKERGIGEIKLLKHKDHGRIRILMRQEKTMKLIVNHFLDPRIVLTPNAGNEKSWVWVAFDFSEGELIETVSPVFVVFYKISGDFVALDFCNQIFHTRDCPGVQGGVYERSGRNEEVDGRC